VPVLSASARRVDIPPCTSTPNEPSSRGISCSATASVAYAPTAGLARKVAAMRAPSTRLWSASPSTVSTASAGPRSEPVARARRGHRAARGHRAPRGGRARRAAPTRARRRRRARRRPAPAPAPAASRAPRLPGSPRAPAGRAPRRPAPLRPRTPGAAPGAAPARHPTRAPPP
jgi:hypothetical protein